MNYQTYQHDTTLTVTLNGDFTFSDHQQFKSLLNTLNNPGVKNIIFDLSGVGFADSAALGMLLIARDETKNRAQQLTLKSPSETLQSILEAACFHEFFSTEK